MDPATTELPASEPRTWGPLAAEAVTWEPVRRPAPKRPRAGGGLRRGPLVVTLAGIGTVTIVVAGALVAGSGDSEQAADLAAPSSTVATTAVPTTIAAITSTASTLVTTATTLDPGTDPPTTGSTTTVPTTEAPTTAPPTTPAPTTAPPTTPAPTTAPTTAPPTTTPSTQAVAPASGCDPNYSGCVPIASDVDCAGGSGNGPAYVNGPVTVIGSDIYGLDADGDGIGCE